MRRPILVTAIVACLALAGLCAAAAEQHVATVLLSDREKISAGETFRVGILFKIPGHGHIYWLNPGDSGLPTSVEWALPDGFEVGELAWPSPEAFFDDVLDETFFGYRHEVLLYSEVHAPKTPSSGGSLRVAAEASWLVCLEDGMCIPERAELSIDLPFAEASIPSAAAPVFEVYAAQTPRALEDGPVPIRLELNEGQTPAVRVHLGAPWQVDPEREVAAVFFPLNGGAWKRIAPDPSDGRSFAFAPLKPLDGSPAGALRLPVKNAERAERRLIYVRVGR